MMTQTDFSQISVTAKLTAFMRQFSDIPYAQDVAQLVEAAEAVNTMLAESDMELEDIAWYAPLMELRYKSLVALIKQQGVRQIMELASGYSLRGLAMAQDPSITYVETDLETLTHTKHDMVELLLQQYDQAQPKNLHMVVANAMDPAQLEAATEPFRAGQPIAVVNEGLIQYLSFAELDTLTRNVRDLLERHGGVWITPDFTFKEHLQGIPDRQQRFRNVIKEKTGRVMFDNAFDTHEELVAFFDERGLVCDPFDQQDLVPELVSTQTLSPAVAMHWRVIQPILRVWVLSLK